MRSVVLDFFSKILKSTANILRLEGISASRLHPNTADRLRKNQMRGAIEQMRVFVVANTFFAPVLSFQAWSTGIDGIIVAWTTIMLLFSWWLFARWLKSYKTEGSKKDMDTFVSETRINASIWCLGMVLFYPFVSGFEKTILTTIMTGSLALGAIGFAQAPRAAFWYLGIQTATLTLVPLTYAALWDSPSDFIISGLAFLAGVAIFNTLLEQARAQMHAFANQESLLQKSEVVELLLKDYEEQGVEWMWRTDSDGNIVNCPQQILELLSEGAKTDSNDTLLELLARHIDPKGQADLTKVLKAFDKKEDFYSVTLPLYSNTSKKILWIMMRGRPQFEGKNFVGFRGIFADATTRMEAQQQVELLAKSDQLTNTFNRNYIQNHLDSLDPQADNSRAYLIDLDGFKQVNDSYGHTIGDKLLQQVSQRLKQTVDDVGIVARLGGDEFLVIVDQNKVLPSLDEELSENMLAQLSLPYLIDGYDIAISASIGTAEFPKDTVSGSDLLHYADLALYAAKRNGRNKAVAFAQSMQVSLQNRMYITDRLRLAIRDEQIRPYYQPQYCAKTKTLVGFEALARWTDAELGVVGPDIFIPIAEETGLIHQIGESLLRQACRDAVSWKTSVEHSPLTVSVNVSPVQVMRGNVLDTVKSVLSETGLPISQLEIEVTESVLIDDTSGSREVLASLSKFGVKIALDDFGTGYSSLSYLRALPLDRLKIDRSFITDIDDLEAQAVVQTIIDLSQRLNLEVVAEGIETSENVTVLNEMGCDVLQGYYFSRPIPVTEVLELLQIAKASAA